MMKLPKFVKSSNSNEKGETTGSTHHCRLHGCNGLRITVKWPDGATTFPCSKGMKEIKEDTWEIM